MSTKRKYKSGRQIRSVADFEQSTAQYFIVRFGANQRTRHRGFLISWTYNTLSNFINRGQVFEADPIEGSEA